MFKKLSILFVSIFVITMFIFSVGKLCAEEHCQYKKMSGVLYDVDYKIEKMGAGANDLYLLRLDFQGGKVLFLSQTRPYKSLYLVRGKKNEICYKDDGSNVIEYIKVFE